MKMPTIPMVLFKNVSYLLSNVKDIHVRIIQLLCLIWVLTKYHTCMYIIDIYTAIIGLRYTHIDLKQR